MQELTKSLKRKLNEQSMLAHEEELRRALHKMLETLAGKQALAEGVLDLRGDLQAIPLRGGRQAFLAKLQQLMGPAAARPADLKSEISNLKSPLPADRPRAFAQRAHEAINGALVRCEERYPSEGMHTVLLVVVDQNPAEHHNNLAETHAALFGPGLSDPLAPVRLEVIDHATDEALQRLIAAGLIQSTTRASRPLFPQAEGESASEPLSAAEQEKVEAHRAQATRKLKMARLLGEGGLDEEARAPLLEAARSAACALAVAHRVPAPAELGEALLPPLSQCWTDALPALRIFAAGTDQPWRPAAEVIEKVLNS